MHGPCAVIFFVIWLISIVNLTVYIYKLRQWDTSVISKASLILKVILAIYITAIWTWCFYKAGTGQMENSSDIYTVIL